MCWEKFLNINILYLNFHFIKNKNFFSKFSSIDSTLASFKAQAKVLCCHKNVLYSFFLKLLEMIFYYIFLSGNGKEMSRINKMKASCKNINN